MIILRNVHEREMARKCKEISYLKARENALEAKLKRLEKYVNRLEVTITESEVQ